MRYVLDFLLNLISHSAMDRKACESNFGGDKWKLITGLRSVAKGEISSTLHKTQGKVCKNELNAS